MVFSSTLFIFLFLPITLIVHFFLKEKFSNIWLLLVSLFFYSWGEPKCIVLMLISIVANYILALLLSKTEKIPLRWILVILALFINLGMLFYFKYFDFAVKNVNRIFKTSLVLKNIALPIGISFYTFQSLSYVIDVFRKEVQVQKNIVKLGLYISFFPQLIAGPIVRYTDIESQLSERRITKEDFYFGCRRFMVGFAKKILIADSLAPFVNEVFKGDGFSAFVAWTGALSYALQIFFDFSGYSDMAIGLGEMFGFSFPENFNYPYVSSSIKEFWRRWHISLSTWFKDYVYIPLGGSRTGKKRTCLNLFVVFLLTGVWHGASWNFVFWGMYYAFFLIMERLFLGKILEKLPNALGHIYSMLVVLFGWVFFRANGLKCGIAYVKNMFNLTDVWGGVINLISLIDEQYVFCMVIGIIFSLPIGRIVDEKLKSKKLTAVSDIFIVLSFFIAICYLTGAGFSPFLYFRF